MVSFRTSEDIISSFEELGTPIKEDAVDLFLAFTKTLTIDDDTIDTNIEAYTYNHRVTEYNYKTVKDLIDYIKKSTRIEVAENGPTSQNSNKRYAGMMNAPTTPLKIQHRNNGDASAILSTPVSGRVYSISESPSIRHRESPKTWPTPSKSELFSNRKERNVVKYAYNAIDTTLCNEDAPMASTLSIEVNESVGEQDKNARYIDKEEPIEVLRDSIQAARERMNEMYHKEFTTVININYEVEQEVCVCGRIFFDIHANTFIKDSSIILYDENESQVSLILTHITSFTLFPGQIVGVEGIMNNRRIEVSHLYTGYPIQLPHSPINEPLFNESMDIIVARGPYTSHDDNQYEQLEELINVCKTSKPSALILCGPFIPDFAVNTLSFTTTFFKSAIWTKVKNLEIKTVIVPSLDDAIAFPAFPQPPYSLKKTKSNIVVAGNPCMLEIASNLHISISNTDILKDLMTNSYRKQDKGMDNQSLFCLQLLEQYNAYPLYPCLSTPFDASKIRSLECSQIPDIAIVATDKMKFVKEVNNTMFISPGPLALGNGGGTYAHITIYPFKEDIIKATKEKGEDSILNNVSKRCKVDIMTL